MTLTHENPAAGGASGTSTKATEFVLPIVATNAGHYAAPLKISDTAAECIERWADDLAWGRLSLPELPRALRTVYFAGFADGEQSQQERINRLEYLCDLNHFLAHNRGKTGADFMRSQTAELWAVTS